MSRSSNEPILVFSEHRGVCTQIDLLPPGAVPENPIGFAALVQSIKALHGVTNIIFAQGRTPLGSDFAPEA